jgi:hypothetical protein
MPCQLRRKYNQKKIRNTYWRWPQRRLEGNAIDFFVHVLGLPFHDAMRQIIGL